MIYNTFKDIERHYGYAQEYLVSTRDCCAKYLRDVLYEVGSLGVMVGKNPALLSRKEDRAVFYLEIEQALELDALGTEELFDVCKQVREMRLVHEYGDPEGEKEA
jgi:hypothetical protein